MGKHVRLATRTVYLHQVARWSCDLCDRTKTRTAADPRVSAAGPLSAAGTWQRLGSMPSETFVNPDRWERIRQLFEEALGRPRDERTAFLLAVCGSDHDLRAHVTQMLGHYESPGDFLETPAAPVQGAAFGSDSRLQSTIGPGTRVGPYEVAALIGAGGMGEVYRARDTRLGREVAIKVLAPHIAGDGQSRARFEREARAVA